MLFPHPVRGLKSSKTVQNVFYTHRIENQENVSKWKGLGHEIEVLGLGFCFRAGRGKGRGKKLQTPSKPLYTGVGGSYYVETETSPVTTIGPAGEQITVRKNMRFCTQ